MVQNRPISQRGVFFLTFLQPPFIHHQWGWINYLIRYIRWYIWCNVINLQTYLMTMWLCGYGRPKIIRFIGQLIKTQLQFSQIHQKLKKHRSPRSVSPYFLGGWVVQLLWRPKKNIGIWICTKGTRFTTPAPQTARKFWTSVKDLTFVSGIGKGTRFLMYSLERSTLQNKAPFSNQNKGHLGSRYIYIYIYYEWLKKNPWKRKWWNKTRWWFQPIWKISVNLDYFPK